MSLGGISFGGESLAGGVRRTTGREAAEGAALGGVVTTAEGAAVLVGAVLALGSVLGALEGDRRAASSHRSSNPSAADGGGCGGGGGG
jgi:hypothetical protein